MLGFAWSEIILIGAVALVVIGPKDLPKVMRTAGQWSRRLRALASDFQRHVDDMVRQAELDDIKREAEKAMDVGSIQADLEQAVDAPGLQKALETDEVMAAAELPVLPEGQVPPIPSPEAPAEAASAAHEPTVIPAPEGGSSLEAAGAPATREATP